MININLYSTAFCHLCEDAQIICNTFQQDGSIAIQIIDIIDDDELMELYSIRIPVIKRLDTGVELGWPFDESMVKQFLSR